MNDLLPLLLEAKAKKTYSSLKEFINELYLNIPQKDKGKIKGDLDCGDQWVWVAGNAMFSIRIAIAFVSEQYLDQYSKCFNCVFVPVKNFDLQEFCLDINSLRDKVPEIEWAASPYAVNPAHFSITELYYATH